MAHGRRPDEDTGDRLCVSNGVAWASNIRGIGKRSGIEGKRTVRQPAGWKAEGVRGEIGAA